MFSFLLVWCVVFFYYAPDRTAYRKKSGDMRGKKEAETREKKKNDEYCKERKAGDE